ncbi:MAG: permease-like cell division protein FtsX, partial [Gammaproteobacteria bacterium]|nr:permease-like cell division protein FtsX [Gammaproteobacteria bacterium]
IQAIQHSFMSFKRAPWTMSITVLVIAIILILPLLFWLLTDQIKPIVNGWQQGKEISLYLDTSFATTDEADLMERIHGTKGVGNVTFISAETSLIALEKQEGMEDIRRYLPENPLPSMIEVMPTHAVDTPEKLEQLFQVLKQYPHVEQARLNRDWVSRLHTILGFFGHLTWLLGVLFSLMVIFIIRNLLRLAAHDHHDEIQVLKLIGATDAFILRPFLYTGAALGILGVLGAFLGVRIIGFGLAHALRPIVAPGAGFSLTLGLSMHVLLQCVLLGLGLGWIGAYLPLKRQLAHIEPCH